MKTSIIYSLLMFYTVRVIHSESFVIFFFPQQIYKIVPIKDIRNLYVTFPIPDLQKYYKSNPGHYLGHLIGHEGPGSLLSELKSKGKYLGHQLLSVVPHHIFLLWPSLPFKYFL